MKIAIIGASSQVGSSLALYLKEFTQAEPVAFVRSTYSDIFFDLNNIEFRVIKDRFSETDIEGFDAVVDCRYPSRQLYEMARDINDQLKDIFPKLPTGCAYIYMSTIMAFGMPDNYKYVRHFSIPRSTYAYLKRKAERLVRQLSVKKKIAAYNFRLGQVHGFLQSVNSSFREKMVNGNDIVVDGNKDDLVNVIFIPTLAKAVIRAAQKQMPAGTYSLVNEPQWTLEQLYNYYKGYYTLSNKLVFKPAVNLKKRSSSLIQFLKQQRSWLEIFFLSRSKNTYLRVKGKYRVMNVQKQTVINDNAYSDFHLLGKNPGILLKQLDCSPETVFQQEKKMEACYEAALTERRFNSVH